MTRARSSRRRLGGAADRGSFTAEFAVGLPALIVLMLMGLTAVAAATAKLRCVDVAREAALAASRGEAGAAAGLGQAPDGATVSITVEGGVVRAVVRAELRPLGAGLPGLTVVGTASAAVEPGPPGPRP